MRFLPADDSELTSSEAGALIEGFEEPEEAAGGWGVGFLFFFAMERWSERKGGERRGKIRPSARKSS